MRKLLKWCAGTVLGLMMVSLPALAEQASQDGGTVQGAARTIGLAVAAAVAVGLTILGAGYAVAKIGSAALGAAVEKPEMLTRSILFVALAEGLAVLGFAIAMMLLQKI